MFNKGMQSDLRNNLYEPGHDKVLLCHMRTTKEHIISISIRQFNKCLYYSLPRYMYYNSYNNYLYKKFEDSNYRNDPKFLDKQVWANSVYPDQTAPRGAV